MSNIRSLRAANFLNGGHQEGLGKKTFHHYPRDIIPLKGANDSHSSYRDHDGAMRSQIYIKTAYFTANSFHHEKGKNHLHHYIFFSKII